MNKTTSYGLATLTVLFVAAIFFLLLPSHLAQHKLWLWFSSLLSCLLILLTLLCLHSKKRIRNLKLEHKLTMERLRALMVAIERSPTSILVTDTKGNIEYANPTICNFTGYSLEELKGKNSSIFNSGKTPKDTHNSLWLALNNGEQWNGRFISITKDGNTFLEQAWISPVHDDSGQLKNYVAVKLDITEQERVLNRKKLHNEVLELLSCNVSANKILEHIIKDIEHEDSSLIGVIYMRSADGNRLDLEAAPSAPVEVLEVLKELELDSTSSSPLAAVSAKRHITTDISQQQWGLISQTLVQHGLNSCYAEPILDAGGHVEGVMTIYHTSTGKPDQRTLDILENAASLVSLVLIRSKNSSMLQLAETVYSTSNEALVVTDTNGTFIRVNPAFSQITGYSKEEAIGNNHRLLKSGRHDDEFYKEMWASLNSTGRWQGEIWNKRKDGEIYPQRLSINTTYNSDGSVKFRVSMFSDISEQKANEELVWRQANFDALTKLPNRRYFQENFARELRSARRNQQRLAVIFIDLDGFKPINDNYGHQYGDEVLEQTAQRIVAPLRDTDFVARIGGDEFVILLAGNPDLDAAMAVARRIHSNVLKPFIINGQESNISLSCGISMYPKDSVEQEELIRKADAAMYHAKGQGRNQTVIYEAGLE